MEEMPASQQKPDKTIIIRNNSGVGELNGLAVPRNNQNGLTHRSRNPDNQVVGLNTILQDLGGGAKIKTRVRFVLGQLICCFLLTTDMECFVIHM